MVTWAPQRRYSVEELAADLQLEAASAGRATRPAARSRQARHGDGAPVWIPHPEENAVLAALRECGLFKAPLGDGRHDITCPWVHEHTGGVDGSINALRPVTADVTMVAPIPDAPDFIIQLTPNTLATRTEVEAELRDLIMRKSEPGGTILLSYIREAISLAAGETDSVLTASAANVAHALGHMAVFGATTWA